MQALDDLPPGDPHKSEPKTLGIAKEYLSSLREEISLLQKGQGTPRSSEPVLPTPKPPSVQADPAPFNPRKTDPSFKEVKPAPVPKPPLLPVTANTPYLVDQILRVTPFSELIALLENPAHTPLQTSLIYQEVKARRAIVENRYR